MEFFKELFLMSENLNINMHIMRVGEKLIINVLPAKIPGAVPVTLEGTYEEFDQEFFNLIKAPMDKARVTVLNLDSYNQQLDDLDKQKQADIEAKKKSPLSSSKPVAKKGKSKQSPVKKKVSDTANDDDKVPQKPKKEKKAPAPKKAKVQEEPIPGEQQKQLF